MKKLLLLIVTLLVALTCGLSSVAYAAEQTDYKQNFAYKFIEEFTENYPNRATGITVNNPFYFDDNGNPSLQQYLKDKIVEASDGAIKAANVTSSSFSVSESKKGYNIEARLTKSSSDKQIIIGAHYDSDGQGANDNASGVAALLLVVQKLSKAELPCNVVFVLFDGEELGMLGSYSYVNNEMTQTDKDNTLLMINMDSIANGDNLYVWCENKRTDLAELILSKSDKLIEKPYAKGTYNLDAGNGYGYVEIPQSSDQTPFRRAGIPTALFFSGTYSAEPWNYSESENINKNNMNSANDTFANLEKNNGAEFVAKINAVANAVADTVLDESFTTTAEAQRKQLVNLSVLGNSWWASLICGVILVAVIVAALLYYRKLQKNAILGTAEVKNNKVFSTPNAEDIFTFKDTKPDAEDIFTFKK